MNLFIVLFLIGFCLSSKQTKPVKSSGDYSNWERHIFASDNSDGDFEMLQYADGNQLRVLSYTCITPMRKGNGLMIGNPLLEDWIKVWMRPLKMGGRLLI